MSDGLLDWTHRLNAHQSGRPANSDVCLSSFAPFNGGNNVNAFVRFDLAGSPFLLKVGTSGDNLTDEAGRREELVSILGRFLDVPTTTAWAVNYKGLSNEFLETITSHVEGNKRPRLNFASSAVMRLLAGATIEQDPSLASAAAQADPAAIADLFAFMLWIGDEDRGRPDVMTVNGRLTLIDNGLCGPGRSSVIRSAHPYIDPYRENPNSIVKMSYPAKPSLVCFILREAGISPLNLREPRSIQRIEAMPNAAIFSAVETSQLPRWVAETLILRRDCIREDYAQWLPRAVQVCGK